MQCKYRVPQSCTAPQQSACCCIQSTTPCPSDCGNYTCNFAMDESFSELLGRLFNCFAVCSQDPRTGNAGFFDRGLAMFDSNQASRRSSPPRRPNMRYAGNATIIFVVTRFLFNLQITSPQRLEKGYVDCCHSRHRQPDVSCWAIQRCPYDTTSKQPEYCTQNLGVPQDFCRYYASFSD